MKDYDVGYKGMIIANVKGATEKKALNMARKIYGQEVTVTLV